MLLLKQYQVIQMSSFIIFAYVILEFRLIINIQININLHISLDHKILYLLGILNNFHMTYCSQLFATNVYNLLDLK